jgi:YidC/Oxa1 family membrane protein insertase
MPIALPLIGQNLSLLPLLMGGTMIWQSALTPTPPTVPGAKPNPMVQQQFMMKWVMPVVMTFIFYKMPSGLVIYWIVSTLMGIAQQAKLNRSLGPIPGLVAAPSRVEGRASHGRSDRVDGKERGGSAAERTDRAGRTTS